MRTLPHRISALLLLLAACRPDAGAEAGPADSLAVLNAPAEVVARWEGGSITAEQVESRIGAELRELEIRYQLALHERRARVVEQLVDAALLEEEASARGLANVDDLLDREVEDKVPEPTEQQIAALYPAVAEQLGGVALDLARPVLRDRLVRQAREARYRKFIEELREEARLELRLPYPELPRIHVEIAPHDPVLGPNDAPVTVIQFAEYTCTWCVESGDALRRIREAWPKRVRVVFKDFPLTGNPRALPAALAAQCAREQDHFWEMHDRLLSQQHALSDTDLVEHAVALQLDRDRFEDCLFSSRPVDGIYEDLAQGREAGVRGTPTWFVNGILVPGVQPWPVFVDIVERELERTASR